MNPIIIEKGSATSVDWNNYDLTLEQAAQELYEGRNIIALEHENFSTDEDDIYSFPQVDDLKASDYVNMSVEDIIDSIRAYYESFGTAIKK